MNKIDKVVNNNCERHLSNIEPYGRTEQDMNNERNCCANSKNVIKGITCDVVTCQYHTGEGHCTAGHIKVGPNQAEVSRETLCTTFKNRTE